MATELIGFGGAYLGTAACYRPDDRTICLGKEITITVWMHHEEDEAIRFLIDVLCHEEDHRAIHEITKTPRTALYFDHLFGHPFDVENREYFRFGIIHLFEEKLTDYDKMLIEKDRARRRKLVAKTNPVDVRS
jgi:hypothetical protein